MIKLMEFRNSYPAFNGDIVIEETIDDEIVTISWEKSEYKTTLKANLKSYDIAIDYSDPETGELKNLIFDLGF